MSIWYGSGGVSRRGTPGMMGGNRRPGSYSDAVRAQAAMIAERAPAIRDYIATMERESPRGIQSQVPGLAMESAGTMAGGLSPEEKEASIGMLRKRMGSMLGKMVAGGATGGALAAEAAPALASAEADMIGREMEARREGARGIFGALSPTLLRDDPIASSFGQLMAQPFGPRRWFRWG